jgi:Fe-S cluster assembly protein SufD
VSNVALDISLGEGAHLTRVVIEDDAEDAVSIATAEVSLGKRAHFAQTVLTTGAKLQRHETRLAHPGEGAEVRIDGLYMLDGARHSDLTSVVSHGGLNGVTSQLTKGVVRDTARGVFQGKIIVERGADGTDARMGHHALILGERAEIDAKPELEIYADDVQCAHGNTVGNLDESALFYMQQRGIPAEEGRALLTQAFLIEVVDRIEHEGSREVVREWLEARL